MRIAICLSDRVEERIEFSFELGVEKKRFMACHTVCYFSSTVWFLVHGSWFAKREAKSFYDSWLSRWGWRVTSHNSYFPKSTLANN